MAITENINKVLSAVPQQIFQYLSGCNNGRGVSAQVDQQVPIFTDTVIHKK